MSENLGRDMSAVRGGTLKGIRSAFLFIIYLSIFVSQVSCGSRPIQDHVKIAQEQFKKGNMRSASDHAISALELSPKNLDARFSMNYISGLYYADSQFRSDLNLSLGFLVTAMSFKPEVKEIQKLIIDVNNKILNSTYYSHGAFEIETRKKHYTKLAQLCAKVLTSGEYTQLTAVSCVRTLTEYPDVYAVTNKQIKAVRCLLRNLISEDIYNQKLWFTMLFTYKSNSDQLTASTNSRLIKLLKQYDVTFEDLKKYKHSDKAVILGEQEVVFNRGKVIPTGEQVIKVSYDGTDVNTAYLPTHKLTKKINAKAGLVYLFKAKLGDVNVISAKEVSGEFGDYLETTYTRDWSVNVIPVSGETLLNDIKKKECQLSMLSEPVGINGAH